MTLTNKSNNFSALGWFTDLRHLHHNKTYSYGNAYPFVIPLKFLIPFQIIRPTSNSVILKAELFTRDGELVLDLTEDMIQGGLVVKRFESRGFDVVVYPATIPLTSDVPGEGWHYLQLSDGVNTFTSELFNASFATEDLLKIVWYDREDFIFESGEGAIVYQNPPFKNIVYLRTEIGKPDYFFDETGEERDRKFFPLKQISEKRYKFTFLANESLIDALRTIRMSDYVGISSMGKEFRANNLLITPEWQDQGDLAAVTAEFDANTIVKKISKLTIMPDGCDFNSDFGGTCGGGGGTDPVCVLPSSLEIVGPNTANTGQAVSYSVIKTGGNSQNDVYWSISGGVIVGSNGLDAVSVQWGDSPGVREISCNVICLEGPNQGNIDVSKSVTLVQSCSLPTSIDITGPTTSNITTPQTYGIQAHGGGSGYSILWSITPGSGTFLTPATSPTVQIQWGDSIGTYNLHCVITCESGNRTAQKLITLTDPASACVVPTAVNVNGPATAVVGVPTMYSIAKTGGSANNTYSWNVPFGGTINGSATGQTISITWNTAGTRIIQGSAACGASAVAGNLSVNISTEPAESALFRMPAHPLPVANDTSDWSGYPDFTLPQRVINVAGDGFGLWANETTAPDGKLSLLKKGFTNIFNIRNFARAKWDPKNIYAYSQCYYMFNLAVRDCVNGGVNGGVYGDLAAIIAENDMWKRNIPYYTATILGALEIGKRMNWGTSDSIDQPGVWDIPGNEAVLMIDEESMTNHAWEGGYIGELMGYLNKGIMLSDGPLKRVFWYGHPFTNRYNQMEFEKDSTGWGWSDSVIQGYFVPGHLNFGSPGWTDSNWFVDRASAYMKVPWLGSDVHYKKVGGNFVLDSNNRRQFRDDAFTKTVYNSTVTILPEPDDQIKYGVFNPTTGQGRFGTWTVNIDGNGYATIKPEMIADGFTEWHNNARPNPTEWRPESFLWVKGVYGTSNGTVSDMLMMSYKNRGVWDASQAVSGKQLYQEMREVTEPWTFDGNAIVAREIGEDGISWSTIMFAYSGGLAFSNWNDGGPISPLPNKPAQLWGSSQYYGRNSSRLAAIQEAYKELQGENPDTWKFVHFYYPFKGQTNFEPIAMGIYRGTRFYICIIDPNLEVGEVSDIVMTAGASTFNFELVGHEFYLGNFDVPAGLEVEQFTMNYTTIYGQNFTVNGKITDDFTEHYL